MFAALAAIFTKIGVENVNSELATLIRTLVILLVLAGIVVGPGRWQLFGSIGRYDHDYCRCAHRGAGNAVCGLDRERARHSGGRYGARSAPRSQRPQAFGRAPYNRAAVRPPSTCPSASRR